MQNQTIIPASILVTGSAGAIGNPIARHLQQRGHRVRGFDHLPSPGLADAITAKISERAAVRQAAAGMDVILHLAAYVHAADLVDVLLEPNVVGLYEVCEAARLAQVKRLIIASTVQAIGGHTLTDSPVRVADGPLPSNPYALTKVWAETMGEMYARCYGLSVISVRIGWYPRNPDEARRLAATERGPDIFLSHEDGKRFFACAVESPTPVAGQSVIVFAMSRPLHRERVELAPARDLLGYEPQDTWPQGLPFPVAETTDRG